MSIEHFIFPFANGSIGTTMPHSEFGILEHYVAPLELTFLGSESLGTRDKPTYHGCTGRLDEGVLFLTPIPSC